MHAWPEKNTAAWNMNFLINIVAATGLEKLDGNFETLKTWLLGPSPVVFSQLRSAFLIFLSSKITSDGDCSHEIKRSLLLGRKAMTNLDSILKNRNITLPTRSI